MSKLPFIAALFWAALSGAGHTATLTFTDATCNNGNPCGNGGPIDQTYGDIAGLNITYGGVSGPQPVQIWQTGYGDLDAVAYRGGTPMIIDFESTSGGLVSVSAFSIARFSGNNPAASAVVITDLADGAVLDNINFPSVSATGHIETTGLWSSTTGIRLIFGPDNWNTGISNIEYAISDIPVEPGVVPLPASSFLMLGGIAALGAAARRRKSQNN